MRKRKKIQEISQSYVQNMNAVAGRITAIIKMFLNEDSVLNDKLQSIIYWEPNSA